MHLFPSFPLSFFSLFPFFPSFPFSPRYIDIGVPRMLCTHCLPNMAALFSTTDSAILPPPLPTTVTTVTTLTTSTASLVTFQTLAILEELSETTPEFFSPSVVSRVVLHVCTIMLKLIAINPMEIAQEDKKSEMLLTTVCTLESIVTSSKYTKYQEQQRGTNRINSHNNNTAYSMEDQSFEAVVRCAMDMLDQIVHGSNDGNVENNDRNMMNDDHHHHHHQQQQQKHYLNVIPILFRIITTSIGARRKQKDGKTVHPLIEFILDLLKPPPLLATPQSKRRRSSSSSSSSSSTTIPSRKKTRTTFNKVLLVASPSSSSSSSSPYNSLTSTFTPSTTTLPLLPLSPPLLPSPSTELLASLSFLFGTLFKLECDASGSVNGVDHSTMELGRCLGQRCKYSSSFFLLCGMFIVAAFYYSFVH